MLPSTPCVIRNYSERVSSVLRPESTRSPGSLAKWRLCLLLPPSSTLHLTLSSQNPRPVFSPIASPVFKLSTNFATASSPQALVSQHSCPLPAVTRSLSTTLPVQPTCPRTLPVTMLLSVMIHIIARSAFSFLKPNILLCALFQSMTYSPAQSPSLSPADLLGYKHSWNVQSHLKQGTRPSKKLTNIRDVKRYLNGTTLSRDGLLVVRRDEPFAPSRECIIIPRQVTDGLLSALHIKLNHPSCHQLKQAVQRYFFALDINKALDRCSHSCHLCASLKKIPSCLVEQSSTAPPDAVGISFAADVVKRYRQLILVLRETTTSFTSSCLIENERRETLRAGLIRLSLEMGPIAGPCAVVRVDPAPGFSSLSNDAPSPWHRP